MRITKQNGFTLVEIALVLVVTGILIGGVFKAREMIFNANLKRIERDKAGIVAAIYSYQDRYRQLPGDDNFAKQRFPIYSDGINDPAATDINGDNSATIDGSWNGTANSETANFWKHLRASGLIQGDGDDDTQPTNAFGGIVGIRDGSLLISGHVMIIGSISGDIAKILENRFDDSDPTTGIIQSDITSALMDGDVVSSAGANYLDSTDYYMAFRL
jgi:prepilin-type N-terminal cleavage/methylation domain-containing protein